MFYINQQDYPDVPYATDLSEPESGSAREGTFAESGCGPCALMMVVDRLTRRHMGLEEVIRLSYQHRANMKTGTDMKILGPAVADEYGLVMTTSDDEADMAACLSAGGAAVINVGGDHDDHVGVLSDVGHYVFAMSYTGSEFVILDPAYRPGKYDIEVPARRGKVRDCGGILYVGARTLHEDTATRSPGYYLFRRRDD